MWRGHPTTLASTRCCFLLPGRLLTKFSASHQSCDTINNLSHEALTNNARAVARALAILANDISAIEAEQAQASVSGPKVAAFVGASHPMSDLGRHMH